MRVEMPDVGGEHVVEVATAEDQQSVEAFAANAVDPPFGVRSRLRRAYRRLDHPDAFGTEGLVEVTAEFAVAVTDEKQRADVLVQLHQQVARLLGRPTAVRVGRDPGQMDAPARQLDEEQDVETFQEERVDSEEVALQGARRLLTKELAPTRLKPPGCRLDPRLLQDRPHRARGQFDPEPHQLALRAGNPSSGSRVRGARQGSAPRLASADDRDAD